jgi:hypothetical protein
MRRSFFLQMIRVTQVFINNKKQMCDLLRCYHCTITISDSYNDDNNMGW